MTELINISVTDDHLSRVSKASVLKAIEELIWNSLDADADNISIKIKKSTLGNSEIIIEDDGTGISYDRAKNSMGRIGDSWKRNKSITDKNRAVHGNKGEGRFKAFSLGRVIDWDSVFIDKDGNFCSFRISAISDNKNELNCSDIEKSNSRKTGTKVIISELGDNVSGYNFDDLKEKLTQSFAAHLYTYNDIQIYVQGYKINPDEEINVVKDYPIEVDGIEGNHQLRLIEWNNISSKSVYLCKHNGAVLAEHQFPPRKIRHFDNSFSAYIESDILSELNNNGTLSFVERNASGRVLLEESIKIINKHFKDKKEQESLQRIERWKREGIYPFEEKTDIGSIEKIERSVFDIIAANVENKLPKFQQSDIDSKKFTFQLLSQALQDNPLAMRKIMTEVLKLSPEEQKSFAKLLDETSLSSIIKSAKIVSERLNFILGLEELIFNYKKDCLERDQLHKILEKEAWIFDERFTLAGSEKKLEDVLRIHLNELGKREDDDSPVLINGESRGRVDLIFSKVVEPKPGYYDYLVVELKRPSKKITNEVIGQIMGYSEAVRSDERFDKSRCSWKFIAVSNEFDSVAEMRASEKNKSRGNIYNGDGIEIYIMKWSEVIANARARLHFFEEQLKYQATESSALDYLREVHNDFLPVGMQQ